MGGDYTRFTFRPRKLYSAVLKQQGRVSVDADFNEHAEIADRRWRAETLDIIGHCIVPRSTPDAFRIFSSIAGLTIGRGRMYVDGILVENFGIGDEVFELPLAEQRPKDSLPLPAQPFLVKDPAPSPPDTTPGSTHLAFIDVWQREVTSLEDAPDNPKDLKYAPIREVALGGPDTATRIQTAWQVRILPAPGATECDDAVPGWTDMVTPSSGRLTATAPPGPPSTEECLIEPGGGYRGLENRLYRVEIHKGGTVGGGATFKWSRDNGSVVAAVTDIPTAGGGSQITVSRIGRDQVLRFQVDDWIEVLDDYTEFQQTPRNAGHLAKVTGIDEANRILTISPPLAAGNFNPAQPSRHTRVRRWDQRAGRPGVDPVTGVIPVSSAVIELEAGIKVSFSAAANTSGMLRPGDYWVFAARTTTGTIEELEKAPPRGIHHHFCRLALITWPPPGPPGTPAGAHDATTRVSIVSPEPTGVPHAHSEHVHLGHSHVHAHAPGDAEDHYCPVPDGGPTIIDCRRFWPPDAGCCTEVVELGESIQDAIDRLPEGGGCVCLKTGIHEIGGQLRIAKSNVVLHGEGPGATIRNRRGEAMLRIAGTPEATIDNVMVHDLRFEATESAEEPALIELHRVADATIQQCVLAPVSQASRVLEAMGMLISDSSRVRLERNLLHNLRAGVVAVRSGRIDLIGNQLRGPTAEIAAETSSSVGIFGIKLEDDVVGPCRVEHNLLEHYQSGITLGQVADGSIVAYNSIYRAGAVPDRGDVIRDRDRTEFDLEFGRRATDRAQRRLWLFAIDTAAEGCQIVGNFANITDTMQGGIHVTASYTRVEQNEIRSDLTPPDADATPALVRLPLGIYLEQSSDAPRLDHCLVRGNRLSGLLYGIIVRDPGSAPTYSNYVVENRLEGPPGASFGVQQLIRRLQAIFRAHPEFLRAIREKIPELVIQLGTAGIVTDNTESVIIADNHVEGFAMGILLLRAAGARVDGNRVLLAFGGVYAYDSNDARMTDNILNRVLIGLLGQELEGVEIRGTWATEVEAVAIGLFNGVNDVLAGSRVDGGEVGILLGSERDAMVTGSEIAGASLVGMLDVSSTDVTYAHSHLSRCGGRALAIGIASFGNAASVTIESCHVTNIGRSDQKFPDPTPGALQWVSAIGVIGAHSCRIHANRVRSLEDLPSTTVHIPVVAYSSRSSFTSSSQPLDAMPGTRGVEMLDNVVVGPGFPILVLGSTDVGTIVFSNNRCEQREAVPAIGNLTPTTAELILRALLGQRTELATVVLRATAQVVMGNRVTTDGRLYSFSFSDVGNVTAVGNITRNVWTDIPANTIPTPTASFNHVAV